MESTIPNTEEIEETSGEYSTESEMKYKAQMSRITSCPPQEATACDRVAYRWTLNEVVNSADFLPVAIKYPRRPFDTPHDSCKALGLSLFKDENSARKRYNSVIKGHANLVKKVGKFVAKGSVTKSCGLASKPSSKGHFTLYEYESTALESKFSNCGEL